MSTSRIISSEDVVLISASNGHRPKVIAWAEMIPYSTVRTYLTYLTQRGLLKRTGKGEYISTAKGRVHMMALRATLLGYLDQIKRVV